MGLALLLEVNGDSYYVDCCPIHRERTSPSDMEPHTAILAGQHSHPKLWFSRYPVHDVTFSAQMADLTRPPDPHDLDQ